LRTFLWLLFFFIAFPIIKGKAQNTKALSTLSIDEKCVSILLDSKTAVTDVDSLLVKLITQSKYASQLKTILSNGIDGRNNNDITIDKELQEAINQIQQQWQSAEDSRLNAICNKYNIDIVTYQSFLQRWKTDIGLQQSLLPFIKTRLQP
jgi:hypothetical protein